MRRRKASFSGGRAEGRGSAMGVLGSVMDIGHTTGPIVAGVIAASLGFDAAFVGAAAALACSAAFFQTVSFRNVRSG